MVKQHPPSNSFDSHDKEESTLWSSDSSQESVCQSKSQSSAVYPALSSSISEPGGHSQSAYSHDYTSTATSTSKEYNLFHSVYKDDPLSSTMTASVVHKTLISKPPSLILLQDLKIIEKVAVDECLPIHLLNDEFGEKIRVIRRDNEHSVTAFSSGVFQSWLSGSGRQPATWKTLVAVLRECKLNTLATFITGTMNKDVMNLEPLPYSNSLEITGFIEWLKQKYLLESVVDSPLLRRFGFYNEMKFVNLTFISDTGGKRFMMDRFLHQVNEFHHRDRLMVITGDPGSGKTTLMRYLAREWAEGKVLQSCQILFLIHLGDCTKEYKSLSDLLKSTEYDDYGNIEQISKMIGDEHGKGTCFLLDAYDEKLVKRDFLDKLINLNRLPLSKCIVTSRPSFANKLKHGVGIKVIGFDEKYFESYVSQLPEEIKTSIHHLWSNHTGVKEACQSPLYLSLMIYMVALDPKHEFPSSSMTQLYLGVMDSLLVHYQYLHHKWNARSLRNCVTKRTHCSEDMLCCAFTTLQRIAFDMVFKDVDHFEIEEPSIYESIKNLSIVSIHPVSHDMVTYMFTHRTFAEFFAAFHITTLPNNEVLFYITRYRHENVVWPFFFGLMGKYFKENVTTISTVFKRYISGSYPKSTVGDVCYQYCNAKNQVALTHSIISVIQELGWMNEDFYASTGIVVNSSVIIQYGDLDTSDFVLLLKYIFKVSTVHKLCYRKSGFAMITVEDWTLKINQIHLEFILAKLETDNFHKFAVPVVALPETTSITSICYRMESLFPFKHWFLELLPHSRQICLVEGLVTSLCPTVGQNDLKVYSISDSAYKTLLTLPNVSDLAIHSFGKIFKYDVLSSFSSLQTLELNLAFHGSITDLQLSGILRKPGELHTLKLHHLPCDGIPIYLSGLTELKHVHIDRSNLSECTDNFLYCLSRNRWLITLEITRSEIEVLKLVEILPMFTFLEELRLEYTGLSDSDIRVLSLALANLTRLSSLSLGSEFITDASVRMLANSLNSDSHQSFCKLRLLYNYIGKYDSDFSSLSRLSYLTHLSIQAIMQYENLFDIVKVFQSLTQLTYLCWSSYSLTDEEKDHLIKTLNNLTELRYLQLDFDGYLCRFSYL